MKRTVRPIKQGAWHSRFARMTGDLVELRATERQRAKRTPRDIANVIQNAAAGDTIITLEVSRLSRSTKQLCELIDLVRQMRLRLVIMGSITVDCRNGEIDPMTKAFLQMAGVFAEVELAMIRARVRSGLQNAVSKGRKLGRRPLTRDDIPAVFYKHYPSYLNGSLNITELARVCGCTRPTIYHYIETCTK